MDNPQWVTLPTGVTLNLANVTAIDPALRGSGETELDVHYLRGYRRFTGADADFLDLLRQRLEVGDAALTLERVRAQVNMEYGLEAQYDDVQF